MFTKLIEALKATRRTIVFTEGPDARILEAAARLKAEDLMNVILVGNVEEVKANAAKGGFDIEGMEILDPATYEGMEEMVAKMGELRKGKMAAEDCAKALSKGNYFGTMLVKMGKADALLGGATYSTADTVRPSRSAADQDQARCQPGQLLLHYDPRRRRPRSAEDLHGRLRHQPELRRHPGQGR